MSKLRALFRSRRFWAASVALLLVLFQETTGIHPDTVFDVVWVATAWIVGDSLRETS